LEFCWLEDVKTTALALEPRLNDVFSFARSILYSRG